jgi:HK97 family phage major capsid protein
MTTDAKRVSGAGAVVPAPLHEMEQAMAAFLNDFSGFQAEIDAKFQQQEERITMLNQKTMTALRPNLAQTAETGAPHQKAFAAYVRNGDDDALRGLALDEKALNLAGDGGFLVDPQTAATVQSVLNSTASIRAIANVVTVESTSYDVLIDHGEVGSGWASEAAATTETDTPQVERVSIPLHELSAMPKASQRLLDDSAFDVEGWLASRIAEKFARAEAAAFINGDGVDKPKGFVTYNSADVGAANWGELEHVRTGADGDFAATNPADAIVDLVYALGAQYRAGASFVMNSKTAGAVRKMKDGDGRFLWSDGLAAGEPARLLGYPVLIAEDMPDIATWAPAIAFGDFAAGYTVAERPDLRILRDPFSAKPHVLFYATKRVGGDVSDFNAIKLLKFAA